jgi:serine/threonine-protein kinase RsbW
MEAVSRSSSGKQLAVRTIAEVTGCINDMLDALLPFSYPERDLFGIRLSLEEAIVNAIRHGHRNDTAKTVQIRFEAGHDQFVVEIEDEGCGFNPDGLADPLAPENLERPGGRGVFLMRNYMTSVSYNERGNCVTMCRRRSNA